MRSAYGAHGAVGIRVDAPEGGGDGFHFRRDGAGLEKVSEIFKDTRIEASVDEVFGLDDVNEALRKVASGGSRGKTVLKIS